MRTYHRSFTAVHSVSHNIHIAFQQYSGIMQAQSVDLAHTRLIACLHKWLPILFSVFLHVSYSCLVPSCSSLIRLRSLCESGGVGIQVSVWNALIVSFCSCRPLNSDLCHISVRLLGLGYRCYGPGTTTLSKIYHRRV